MEHLTFKGTTAYPSTRAISEAIEGVGGSFNAATDRESTVYWVRVPRREVDRAMDVIGELIVRPRLEDADIESERTVIVEEIRSYLDDPSEYCQILFQTAMFGDGPLGREICGDEADILALPEGGRSATSGRAPTGRRTRSSRSSATCPTMKRSTLAATAFGTGNGAVPGFAPAPALPAGPRLRTGKRDTSQAQICLGVPALHRDHPDSWTLAVLNAVLGDGMSSRLFLSVREELGLAYDVSSGLVDYADAGALEVIGRGRSGRAAGRPRGDPRRARPAARRARPGDGAREGQALSRRAASSCAWTTPATWRRGSAGRRRSTTAC